MKKILFFLFFLGTIFYSMNIIADDNIYFEYDNSGNCVLKYKTIVMRSAKKSQAEKQQNPNIEETEQTDDESQIELLGDRKLVIYPNPTKGHLKIEIQGAPIESSLKILLLDMSGRTLYTTETSENIFNLDLTRYNPGTYILRLQLEAKQSEWKIIKQ